MGYLSRHNVHRIFVSSLLFTIVSFMNCVKAQVVDDTMHVIYAKTADRISVRTNPIDWVLLCPNVGLEYNIRKENWNRWAVGVNVKGRWKGSNTFKPGIVYNLNEIRVDFKNYWRERFVRGEGSHVVDGNVDPHTKWIDKLFSLRRKNLYDETNPKHTYPYLKHPAIVFFRGIYGSYDKYSFKMGKTGYQGDAFSIGGSYGIIRTLHEYEKGGRLDLELGISAGWIYLMKCQEYTLNRYTNNYVKGENKSKFIPYPMVTDLRLGFVYHFGKMPLTQQYRWRYDADSAFHVYVDSLAADRQAKWEQKQVDKSYKAYILPVKTAIADARKTLNSWPDTIYPYMVLQRAIDQAVKDSSELLMPVYVNKGVVYDKDAGTKIEVLQRELSYYRGRAENYVATERRIKFVADSIYADSVKRVTADSIATAKRNKFVADSLRRDSVSSAKRVKFLNDSIMKDSLKQIKDALNDSLKAAKAEAKQRAQEIADSLKAAKAAGNVQPVEGAEGAASEVTPTETPEGTTPQDESSEASPRTSPDESTDSGESSENNTEGAGGDSGDESNTGSETTPSESSSTESSASEQPAEQTENAQTEQQNESSASEQPAEQTENNEQAESNGSDNSSDNGESSNDESKTGEEE